MIGFIRGKVVAGLDGGILIENHGIGYEVNVPDSSSAYLKIGTLEEITIYTVMIVREDDMSLYGFVNQNEIKMFKALLSVNGVGAKAALAMLSMLSVEEISKAILFDDVNTIKRAQGIGNKIAQRVVLELKDKIGNMPGLSGIKTDKLAGIETLSEDAKTEALQALLTLGYSKSEAAEVILKIGDEATTTEQYIKAALKKLM